MAAFKPHSTQNTFIRMVACSFVPCCQKLVAVLLCLTTFVGYSRGQMELPRVDDQWYTIEFDQKPVGYERILVRTGADGLVNCQRNTRLQLRRLGQDLSLHATLETVQKQTGELLQFRLSRADASASTISRSGRIDSAVKTLELSETQGGTTSNRKLKVRGDVFSPLISQWLPAQFKSGRQRSRFAVMFPETSQVSEVFAERKLPANLRVGRQKMKAMRANFFPSADATRVTRLWFDANDDLLQSEKRVLGGSLKLVRTTATKAISAASGQSLDLDVQSLVPTAVAEERIKSPNLILDLKVENGLAPDVPQSATQLVQRMDAQTVRIQLLETPQKSEQAFETGEINGHPLLPIDSVELQRMARIGAGAVGDDLRRCQRLEGYVRQSLSRSAFSTQMIAADLVARRKRGDCTEHATLLCALLRCSGIRSRLASGLVTIPQRPAMTGHVWVEAYVSGAWHTFDSSLGSATKNVPRIKLAHESFDSPDDNGISLFIPILEIAGRARLEIVSR